MKAIVLRVNVTTEMKDKDVEEKRPVVSQCLRNLE